MKRNKRNPEKTRQEIIQKSAPVFNQHGFAGTTLEMLIQATGYQKGGIYCHFDSKMDLAREAFKYNFSLLQATYGKESNPNHSPTEQLFAFLNGFKNFIVNPPIPGGCPLLNMAVEADDTDETNRLLVKDALNEWKAGIEKILTAGVASGDFKKEINVTQEALFIIASIEGSIMLGQIKKSIGLMLGIADSLQKYIELRILKG